MQLPPPYVSIPEKISEYYAPLAPPGIEVRFISKEKGKGMFAKRAFKKGELIFEEKPLISMQEAANKDQVLCCAYCLRALAPLSKQVQLLLGTSQEPVIPFAEQCSPPSLTLPASCPGGCTRVQYCSQQCAQEAHEAYHKGMCVGPNPPASHPWLAFEKHAIENSDRFILAARIIVYTMQRADACGGDLDKAFYPFSWLTAENWTDQLAYDEETRQLVDESRLRKQLLRESLELLKKAVYRPEYDKRICTSITCLDREVFNLAFYSKLMGMIFMNFQEIGVFSPVRAYMVLLEKLPPQDRDKACEQFAPLLGKIISRHGGVPHEISKSADDTDGKLSVIATRDIKEGEEITISYRYFEESDGYSDRQKILKSQYLFNCDCSLCQKQRPKRPSPKK